MKDVKQSTRLRPLTNQELIDSYDYLSGAASSKIVPALFHLPLFPKQNLILMKNCTRFFLLFLRLPI